MKKLFLILLSAGFCIGGIAMDVPLQITTRSSRWKHENNVYTLRQVEKGRDRLVIHFSPEESTWFRFDWAMRYSDADPSARAGVRIERDGKMGRFQFPATTKWERHTLYFSAKNAKSVKIDITLLQCNAGDFQIRDCKITTLGQKPFSLQLFSGGENDTEDLPFRFCLKTTGIKIVSSNAFLTGEKALEVESQNTAQALLQTVPLPVLPGKEYLLKFWAQSASVKAMAMSISCWSPWRHRGKHFYKRKVIKLDKECQEFSLSVKIPDDCSAVPDLQDGVNIVFESLKGERGKILLNDISFAEKEK